MTDRNREAGERAGTSCNDPNCGLRGDPHIYCMPTCARCGDVADIYDEATEFGECCYEYEMGEPMPDECFS